MHAATSSMQAVQALITASLDVFEEHSSAVPTCIHDVILAAGRLGFAIGDIERKAGNPYDYLDASQPSTWLLFGDRWNGSTSDSGSLISPGSHPESPVMRADAV